MESYSNHKLSFSDRVEAVNLKSRLAMVQDEIRQSNLSRTDTSNSITSQTGKGTNKRITFQEDINRASKLFHQSMLESDEARGAKPQEIDIGPMKGDIREDVAVSSISSHPLSTI